MRVTTRTEWHPDVVNRILHNQKYAGYAVFGRRSEMLETRRVSRPKDDWVLTPGAWKPVVSPDVFEQAQRKFQSQTFFKTDEEVLDGLRGLWKAKGRVSQRLIDEDPGLPSARVYKDRFGSLSEALARIGYERGHTKALESRRLLRRLRDELIDNLIAACSGRVCIVQHNGHWKPSLRVLDRLRVSIYMCRCVNGPQGQPYWRMVHRPTSEHLSVSLLVRLNRQNDGFLDFFVVLTPKRFTSVDFSSHRLEGGIQMFSLSDFPDIVEQIHARA